MGVCQYACLVHPWLKVQKNLTFVTINILLYPSIIVKTETAIHNTCLQKNHQDCHKLPHSLYNVSVSLYLPLVVSSTLVESPRSPTFVIIKVQAKQGLSLFVFSDSHGDRHSSGLS